MLHNKEVTYNCWLYFCNELQHANIALLLMFINEKQWSHMLRIQLVY